MPGIADECQTWDLSGFTTWPQVHKPIRVVRSCETRRVRRQLDGEIEEKTSKWMWVTTLNPHRAPTSTVIQLGHARWCIENQGFNETVNRWHADHVYKHDADAMLAFCWPSGCWPCSPSTSSMPSTSATSVQTPARATVESTWRAEWTASSTRFCLSAALGLRDA